MNTKHYHQSAFDGDKRLLKEHPAVTPPERDFRIPEPLSFVIGYVHLDRASRSIEEARKILTGGRDEMIKDACKPAYRPCPWKETCRTCELKDTCKEVKK